MRQLQSHVYKSVWQVFMLGISHESLLFSRLTNESKDERVYQDTTRESITILYHAIVNTAANTIILSNLSGRA